MQCLILLAVVLSYIRVFSPTFPSINRNSHSCLFCYLPFKLETVHVQCCLYKSIDPTVLGTLSFLLNLLSIADKLAFNIRTNYLKAVSQVWVFRFNHEIYLSVQYSINVSLLRTSDSTETKIFSSFIHGAWANLVNYFLKICSNTSLVSFINYSQL